jgi:predicted RNA-binding Zn-ribbon protein involved in translation (DUF1610 family)
MNNLDAADGSGNTKLMISAARGDTKEIIKLLEAGANPLVKDRNGMTARVRAINRNEHEAAVILQNAEMEFTRKLEVDRPKNIENNQGKDPVETEINEGAAIPVHEEEKRIPCPQCGERIVSTASVCRFCGVNVLSKNKEANAFLNIFAYVITFIVLYFAISSFVKNESEKEYEKIMRQAERDAERLLRKY